jgi:hypothetical protein
MANDDAWSSGWAQGQNASDKKKYGKVDKPKKMPKAVGQVTTSDGQTLTPTAMPKQFKKGGKVKRTGVALVHKGEKVLTAAEAKQCASKKKVTRKRVAGKG